MNEEAKKYFWDGIKAEIPLLIGVFPFGLIYGALAINAGLSPLTAQLTSSIIFAGSSQFITAQLVSQATPAIVIILTIAVVNLRHMLYSASLAPYLKHLSMKWKILLSYLLTDEEYAPSILQYEKEGIQPYSHWFVFGALTRQQVHELLAGLDRQPFAAREDHHPFVIIMGDESQQLLDPSHFLCYREFSQTSSSFLRLSTGVPSSRRLQSVQRLPPLFAIACSSSTTQSLPCTAQSLPPAIAAASATHVTDTCHLHCASNGRALRHLLAGYV